MITWTDDYDHCYECTGYGDDYYFDEESRMSDLISRKALCEYALNQKDKSITPNDIMRFPSAQPEKRTEEHTETHACDLISRQAAIDAAYRADYTGLAIEDVKKVTDEVVKELKRLPSAQSERRPSDNYIGEWIFHQDWKDDGDSPYECSMCGRVFDYDMYYCGYCGAFMNRKAK